jgi:hypothetical protein
VIPRTMTCGGAVRSDQRARHPSWQIQALQRYVVQVSDYSIFPFECVSSAYRVDGANMSFCLCHMRCECDIFSAHM